MSLGGERVQGMAGGPIPIGMGRGVTCGAAIKFSVPQLKLRNFVVSGITKDSGGTPLAGVTVDVFETATDIFRGRCVSNADGTYTVYVNSPDTGITFYARADLAGAPERAGTTVDVMTVTEN